METINKRNGVPLHQQLKDVIRSKIKKGEYSSGQRIPTTLELCRNLKLSITTVRRAVTELIAEGFLKGTPGKGTFIIDRKNLLRPQNDNLIGIVFPDMVSNPFLLEVFQGVETTASVSGYKLIVTTSEGNAGKERRLIEELKEREVRGIIICFALENRNPSADRAITKLLEENFPIVAVDVRVPGIPVDCVCSNNQKGGYTAVHYLAKLGHRRIAFIAPLDVSTVRERVAGYRKAMKDFGLVLDPALIKRNYVELQPESCGYHNTLELLRLKKPPTAIFTCTDGIAFGVYRACHQLRLAIPGDISIIGYDDLFYTAFLNPALTTIHQPKVEMGKKVVELLLKRIHGEKAEPKYVMLDTYLAERGSCAIPRTSRRKETK